MENKIALNSARISAGTEHDVCTECKCYVCKQAHVSVPCVEYGLKQRFNYLMQVNVQCLQVAAHFPT